MQFLSQSAHQGECTPSCHTCQARRQQAPTTRQQAPHCKCQTPLLCLITVLRAAVAKVQSLAPEGAWSGGGALGSQPTCQVLLGLGVSIASTPSGRTWWVGILPRGRAQSPSVHVLLSPPTGYLAIWPDTNVSSSAFEPHPSLAWLDWADPLSNTIHFPSYAWGWPWSHLLGWIHVFPQPSLPPLSPPTILMIQGWFCSFETKPLFWVDVPSQKAWLCLSQAIGWAFACFLYLVSDSICKSWLPQQAEQRQD